MTKLTLTASDIAALITLHNNLLDDRDVDTYESNAWDEDTHWDAVRPAGEESQYCVMNRFEDALACLASAKAWQQLGLDWVARYPAQRSAIIGVYVNMAESQNATLMGLPVCHFSTERVSVRLAQAYQDLMVRISDHLEANC